MEYDKTGKLIQELRKEKGLTQLALSDKLGVTDRAVSKWERGKSFPDVSMLKPLSEALGVSIGELLDGERRTPDKVKNLPDGVAAVTVEDADKAAMTGIQTYIHKAQKRERILITAFVIALLALVFMAGRVQHIRHLPVDFQTDDLNFSKVRVVMEDGSAESIALDSPQGEELKRRLQSVLREEMPETEVMGRMEGLPAESARGSSVRLDGLITFYEGVYYDQRSWEYYTFPDIMKVQQKLYSVCTDWLADEDNRQEGE